MSDRPKPKSNAVLKNLPEDRQAQIAEWCEKPNDRGADGKPIPLTGGLAYARKQLADDGLAISLRTLSEFFCWYQLQRDMDRVFEVEDVIKERTGDPKLARERAEKLFLALSMARQDTDAFIAATMSADQRRKLDLAEETGRTKAKHKERSLAQKDRDFRLARDKFERETCELYLKWVADAKARAIAEAPISNEEKIAQLRRTYFADIDALEKSGAVQLPE